MSVKLRARGGAEPEIAEEALDLIEVDYEALPGVFDLLEPAQPDARVARAATRDQRGRTTARNSISALGGNVCSVFR